MIVAPLLVIFAAFAAIRAGYGFAWSFAAFCTVWAIVFWIPEARDPQDYDP